MEISEIKARLSISEVLGHYGLKADKNARIEANRALKLNTSVEYNFKRMWNYEGGLDPR